MTSKKCKTGKVRYRDNVAALYALAKIQHHDKHGHNECRHYFCQDCHGWHLTSKPLKGST